MASDPLYDRARELGEAWADTMASLGRGLRDGLEHPVDRAIREWQALPWYKRIFWWVVR